MKDLTPLAITSAVPGFPARIGVITRIDGTVIRFAESDESIVVDGDTYLPIAGLEVSAITHTANGETPSCEFRAVHSSSGTFDSAEITAGVYDGAGVQIYSVDRLNLTEKGLLFTGQISNIAFDPVEGQVVFQVKGLGSKSRIVMTQRRSPMCRTDLFSTLCGLNAASFDVATTVATVESAFVITVTGSLAQADGYFNQGVLVTADGRGFEIGSWDQSSQALTMYQAINLILSVSDSITLYPGCDKTHDSPNGCKKFSNLLNFQGEPHFNGTAAAAQQVVTASGAMGT